MSVSVSSAIDAGEYAPGLVVDAEALERRLAEGVATTILDARPESRYLQGHLPGSRRIDLDDWRELFDRRAAADAWGESFARLGIEPGVLVVVYDDGFTPAAARAWWLLRYWGVEEAVVLNGGWRVWLDSGGSIDHDDPAPAAASAYPAAAREERLVTRDELERLLEEGAPTLVDTRSAREYTAGRIGDARRLEWSDLVDADSGRLLPAGELLRRFKAAGIDPSKPCVTYCRTGGRASVNVLALEALGAESAASYYGGWSEWSTSSSQQ